MDKKIQLVLDIMRLGVEISENTKADVFVNYSGHVDQLSVRIYEDGLGKGKAPYRKDIYLNTEAYRTEEVIIRNLGEIYAELVNI